MRSSADIERLRRESAARAAAVRMGKAKMSIKHCSICNEEGHYAPTCPNPGPVRTFDDFDRGGGR